MKKYITQIALTRFGLKRFENKVNALMEEGYNPVYITIERKFFKFLCQAYFETCSKTKCCDKA